MQTGIYYTTNVNGIWKPVKDWLSKEIESNDIPKFVKNTGRLPANLLAKIGEPCYSLALFEDGILQWCWNELSGIKVVQHCTLAGSNLHGTYFIEREGVQWQPIPTKLATALILHNIPEWYKNEDSLPAIILELLPAGFYSIANFADAVMVWSWSAQGGMHVCTPASALPQFPVPPPMTKPLTPRELTLNKAKELVMGDREADYGSPKQNFDEIAALWTIILRRQDEPVTAAQVVLCMDAVKTARLMNKNNHEDSWADKAGYAAVGSEVC